MEMEWDATIEEIKVEIVGEDKEKEKGGRRKLLSGGGALYAGPSW